MLSHNNIHEAAHIKLEALREETKRHRANRETDPKPFPIKGVLVLWRREITRRSLGNNPARIPPSPSTNQL